MLYVLCFMFYFMEKMEGSLECFNRDGGFVVKLTIPVV